jgi:hypothetical protein
MMLIAGFGVVAGCRLIVGTTAVTVGAVGIVGYGVYKTGEAAVTGVSSVVSGGAKGVGSVVFFNGDFKAACHATVEEVWVAAAGTLQANGFRLLSAKRDALSGHLDVLASNDDEIKIRMDAAGQGQTEVRVRVGVTGNLKKSEALYELITKELDRQRAVRKQEGA